jgi:hypothetical protein
VHHTRPKKARIFEPPPSAIPSSDLITSTDPLPTLPNVEIYAPYSPLPLLARLRSYVAGSFVELESPLDPITLASNGWICQDREAIRCGQCKRKVALSGVSVIRDEKVRKEVVRRMGSAIKGRHRKGCPWTVKECPGEF